MHLDVTLFSYYAFGLIWGLKVGLFSFGLMQTPEMVELIGCNIQILNSGRLEDYLAFCDG